MGSFTLEQSRAVSPVSTFYALLSQDRWIVTINKMNRTAMLWVLSLLVFQHVPHPSELNILLVHDSLDVFFRHHGQERLGVQICQLCRWQCHFEDHLYPLGELSAGWELTEKQQIYRETTLFTQAYDHIAVFSQPFYRHSGFVFSHVSFENFHRYPTDCKCQRNDLKTSIIITSHFYHR